VKQRGSIAVNYGLAGPPSISAMQHFAALAFQHAATPESTRCQKFNDAGTISTAAVDNFVGIWAGKAKNP